MRTLTLAFALMLALLSSSAFAQGFDTPKALLEDAYGRILKEDYSRADEDYFSERLRGILAAADKAAHDSGDEVGALDFSPLIGGQDSGGLTFAIGEPAIKGNRARATVQIIGFGPKEIRFDLIKQDDGWWIDDLVEHADGEDTYRLSELLSEPPSN